MKWVMNCFSIISLNWKIVKGFIKGSVLEVIQWIMNEVYLFIEYLEKKKRFGYMIKRAVLVIGMNGKSLGGRIVWGLLRDGTIEFEEMLHLRNLL